jgi:predicted phage-related endonuclease
LGGDCATISQQRNHISFKGKTMADAYQLAKQHLDAGIAEAAKNNVSVSSYGQALIWKLIERYKEEGRSASDIASEIQYTLDNIDDDGTFHVSRN